MGFNISGAISGALTGFTVGGPTGAVVGGAIGGLTGGGGGGGPSVGFAKVPETEQGKFARGRLLEIAEGEPPEIPLRRIAPLQPITEERQLARETAKAALVPQEQEDFFSLPDVMGIIERAITQGDLLANRLARALQQTGNLRSTSGRGVLGRVVSEVESNIAASLAPFAESQRNRAVQERQRIQNLIPVLEGLGLTEEDRARAIEQAGFDADFAKELAKSQQLQSFTIPLLQSIIGLQPAVQPFLTGGGAEETGTEGIIGSLGPLLTSILGKGTNTTSTTPATTSGSPGGFLDLQSFLGTQTKF